MITTNRDLELERDVLDELKNDLATGDPEVWVSVEDGIVTLTGTVRNYSKRAAASVVAAAVIGVRGVINDIIVQDNTTALTDNEIAESVRWALRWNVLVPEDRIESKVNDGVVTLTGEVNRMVEREDAERAVSYLAGVKSVRNQIVIRETIDSDPA